MTNPPRDHLLALSGEWSLWRDVCLRSAGFPAREILRFSSPNAVAAAERVLDAAAADLPARRAELETILAEEAQRFSAAFREEARDPRVHEAVLWQNRAAYHSSIEALLRSPPGATGSDTRRRELLVASYLQRYRLKNETIGFFGPVCWARFDPALEAATCTAAESLLSKRTVYFEYWGIDALATKFSEDVAVKLLLAPRRSAAIRVEGTILHHPIDRTSELPEEYARILERCDGVTPAKTIAAELELDEYEAYEILEELERRSLITWALELPPATFAPEAELERRLQEIGAEAQLSELAELKNARAQVQTAVADPERLDRALAELEQTFIRLTGERATRGEGKAYAGRTLVFEDCVRDLDVRFGRAVLEKLGPPLALILTSARWYTHEIAARYRAALEAIYERIARETGSAAIDYQRFWRDVVPLFPGAGDKTSIVSSVSAELERRWWRILAAEPEVPRIERSARAIEADVLNAFDAPGPGWPAARHHSPDLMIAAPDVEAFGRAECLIVLGELHTSLNTVVNPFVLKEHPEASRLIEYREVDLPEPCIAPVWSKAKNRTDYFSVSRHDFELDTGIAKSARPVGQVLEIGSLVVERGARGLVARTFDGRVVFDLIALFEQHLIAESYGRFQIVPKLGHVPRVSVDRVVVAREQWRLEPAAFEFAQQKTLERRFVAARRLVRAYRLPRFVFAKVPEETKPVFVDFESPIFVELLARLLRKASALVLSEMLPAFDNLWLPDASGRRYTSELRIAARDERAYAK
jgi:hypothetical protein